MLNHQSTLMALNPRFISVRTVVAGPVLKIRWIAFGRPRFAKQEQPYYVENQEKYKRTDNQYKVHFLVLVEQKVSKPESYVQLTDSIPVETLPTLTLADF